MRTHAQLQLNARIAGFLYLIVILGGTFAQVFVRDRLVVPGDALATFHNIQSHPLLYRLGFVVELFYCACNVPLVLILYQIFKRVSRLAALMMFTFAMLANAVEIVSLLAHFLPLILLEQANTLRAFSADQLGALTYLSVQLFEHGFAASLVFFGFDCLTMAYLIVRSKLLPRIIGILLVVEGLGYLVNSFSLFLEPALQARIFPYFAATAIAEIALCLWLLIRGVDVRQWQANEHLNASNPHYP